MVAALLRERIGAIRPIEVVTSDTVDADAIVADRGLLTFSERRVLRVCQHHDCLSDVADALCIRRDTVKKHLVRIYRKLDSLHRALLRAKELGLLDEQREGRGDL